MTKKEFNELKVGTILVEKLDGKVIRVFEYTDTLADTKLICRVEHDSYIAVLCADQFRSDKVFIATKEDIEEMKAKEYKRYLARISRLELMKLFCE